MTKTPKSTFEEFMKSKTEQQKKEYEDGYRDFLSSEMILAVIEEDNISIEKLAKELTQGNRK